MVKPIKLDCYIGSNNVDKHNSLIGSMASSNDRYVLNNTKMHKHTIIMIKEMEEIRAKGFYFGCNKKWYWWKKCSKKNTIHLKNNDKDEEEPQ